MSDHTVYETGRKSQASSATRTRPFGRDEQQGVAPPVQPVTISAPATVPVVVAKAPQWQAYLMGAVIAGLVLILVYQQMQLNRLTSDLGAVSNDVRKSEVLQSRLDAGDEKLQALNNRLSYLDSKINAVDQKAQTSLDKWRAQESKGNFFGDLVKNIGQTLGLR